MRLGDGAVGRSPFPPIADYGYLSDCHVSALVAPSGNVEWLCLPRPDGPSVFGAMLDRDAGGFRLGPADSVVPAGRRYLPGTVVLETTWMTRTGWLIVRDALAIGPWHHERTRSSTHRRPPTDQDADHVLLRTVKCVRGTVDVEVECEPAFGYGTRGGEWEFASDGYHVAEVLDSAAPEDRAAEPLRLRLTTDLRLGFEGRRAIARSTLDEGDNAFVALAWSRHSQGPSTYDEAFYAMERTSDFWRGWLASGDVPDHGWRPHLQRSALTLKGLTYAPTGAMIAAATTSLPETPGGARNWDYRYSWIRDSTFMLWGLYTLGFDREADEFFYFVADAVGRDGTLQVMYGVEGERTLAETELDHLSGYEGARPVRVGNRAFEHEQHDVWGAFLDSVYLHMKARDVVPEWIWPILERQVEHVLEIWRLPDRGIWEVRGPKRHFTHSKVMCWVAADRGARLAELRGERELATRWQAAADEIHGDVCANALDERGVFCQHFETTALDAAVLLIPLVRYLPSDDERVRATVLAVESELTEDGLVRRYDVEETDDGLGGAREGAFVICSFWLVSALSEIGESERARALCERLLAHSGSLNLYSEAIDPRTGRHLGNFPQAFSHLALINALMHVIAAERRAEGGTFSGGVMTG